MSDDDITIDDSSAATVAARWLSALDARLRSADVPATTELFVEDGWWRDLLALSWDFRTARGRSEIARLLTGKLAATGMRQFILDMRRPPVLVSPSPGVRWIELMARFETRCGRGRSVVRLVPDTAPAHDAWKAWIMVTSLEELKGHEEPIGPRRPRGEPHRADPHREIWHDKRIRTRAAADRDPEVLVVGAGHSGLAVAARLGQLDVQTLVVEQSPRVGDNWRNRYRSLVLHDTVHFVQMPYLAYPQTWPVFCAKDKFADWLEAYATIMELNVATSTTLTSASYDHPSRRWSACIVQGGVERVVHPAHLIFATGLAADPLMPSWPGADAFKGLFCHSSTYVDGRSFAGQRALVVGAGNSGLDIARDLWECGAEVTILQRSSTYVFSIHTGTPLLYDAMYSDTSLPPEDADLLRNIPHLAALDLRRQTAQEIAELDRDLLEGLARAGFKTNMGAQGAGLRLTALMRAGGYVIDVGCGELIASGHVKVKQGVEIARLTEHGAVFTDGASIDVDAIFLATGFGTMRDMARRIIGDEMADRCSPTWGLDAEGEINGIYRPSGQQGLWFASNGVGDSRFLSKYLALQIKARIEGIAEDAPALP